VLDDTAFGGVGQMASRGLHLRQLGHDPRMDDRTA
jgi:hypothetical protein